MEKYAVSYDFPEIVAISLITHHMLCTVTGYPVDVFRYLLVSRAGKFF
jgi:hypothetical protein